MHDIQKLEFDLIQTRRRERHHWVYHEGMAGGPAFLDVPPAIKYAAPEGALYVTQPTPKLSNYFKSLLAEVTGSANLDQATINALSRFISDPCDHTFYTLEELQPTFNRNSTDSFESTQ